MIAGAWQELSDLHFLRPLWLLLLLAGLGLSLWWRRSAIQRSAWSARVDARLLRALLDTRGDTGVRVLGGLLPRAAFLIAVLALAGPAFRELPQPLQSSKAGLVIVLDLSDGMRAADVAPSRYARARFEISDLLERRKDGQTGLLVYADDAFTVSPLTDDGETLRALLGSLEPDVMPVRGQRLERALRQGGELLAESGFRSGDLIVISHRADPADAAAAAELAERGYRVHVLGIGSEAGAPVPIPGGGFLRGDDGEIALPRLDAASLQAVAEAGGGRYVAQRADDLDLAELPLDQAGEAEASDAQGAQQLRYVDDGPFLLLLLLPLAALLFRRGLLFALPLALLGALPAPAQAFEWNDLWQRGDQRAWQALQQGDHAAAQADPEAPAAVRGAAAYREDQYDVAAAQFAGDDSADAHYNRGNALARAGQLGPALKAYDQALQRAPEMDDARHNRGLVEQALKQQQEQQSQPSDQDSKPQQGEGEQQDPSDSAEQSPPEGENAAPQDAQPGDERGDEQASEGEQDPASDDQAEAEQAADEATDEAHRQAMEQALQEAAKAEQDKSGERAAVAPLTPEEAERRQATEQWLRRIPDDPGGLLRRKFALEQRRRLMEEQER